MKGIKTAIKTTLPGKKVRKKCMLCASTRPTTITQLRLQNIANTMITFSRKYNLQLQLTAVLQDPPQAMQSRSERALKYTFNPFDEKWHSTGCRVVVEKQPFAEGKCVCNV